jgi:sec-independent protein translocase protein TatB
MFDIGFFELLVVFVIGLLVLGPERLPKVVRAIGHWTGRAKATLNNLKYEIEREAYNEEMKERFKKQLQELGIDEDALSSGKHEEQKTLEAPPDSPQNEKNDR